jgi:hypothetical protein
MAEPHQPTRYSDFGQQRPKGRESLGVVIVLVEDARVRMQNPCQRRVVVAEPVRPPVLTSPNFHAHQVAPADRRVSDSFECRASGQPELSHLATPPWRAARNAFGYC